MNKTQKGALAVLVITAVFLIFSATIPFAWFSDVPVLRILPLAFLALACVVMGLSIIFFIKKQSCCEVDFDERDITIKRKAILASYIALWVLICIACIIPYAILGEEGSIKVDFLPIIIFGVFLFSMLVYSIAILIQYSWGGKDGQG